ncbi:hypothetical protein [Lactiplantibacillus plantarum]|uniref:hypothetical protein n=1 Tax=Lactiplantibacillus plantarum TaxID=1590 RepID=UPI001BA69E8E|nr:hypothetical protein [Lactiplantibacillus plantarum]MBS0935726.1 hypothetical protein [Lactiplantibacillus plantarum]MBS0943917.1 hypothetical protein [Lactiplantibacillus plantarum]
MKATKLGNRLSKIGNQISKEANNIAEISTPAQFQLVAQVHTNRKRQELNLEKKVWDSESSQKSVVLGINVDLNVYHGKISGAYIAYLLPCSEYRFTELNLERRTGAESKLSILERYSTDLGSLYFESDDGNLIGINLFVVIKDESGKVNISVVQVITVALNEHSSKRVKLSVVTDNHAEILIQRQIDQNHMLSKDLLKENDWEGNNKDKIINNENFKKIQNTLNAKVSAQFRELKRETLIL